MTAVAATEKRRKRRLASDEAHSWARNLRLRNPYAKLALCMLALYVNGEGVCFVGIDELANDCELSQDTIRKRLAWLEQIGAIARYANWIDANGRRNAEGRGKRTTDEIRLLIDADPDDIEARASGDDDRGDGDSSPAEAESDGATEEISPRSQQGLNLAEETQSANRSPRLALCQLSDSGGGLISEPEPEPPPKALPQGQAPSLVAAPEQEGRGSAGKDDDPLEQRTNRFRQVYPIPFENVGLVRQLLSALTESEFDLCVRAAQGYAIFVKNHDRNPKGAHKFIYDPAQWPEYARLAPAPPPKRRFLVEGLDEWRALAVLNAIADRPIAATVEHEGRRGRWVLGGALPAEALLLAAHFDTIAARDSWPIAEERSNSFGAWREKLEAWIGTRVEPETIRLAETYEMEVLGKRQTFNKRVSGLRVPRPFPPSKAEAAAQAGMQDDPRLAMGKG